MVETIQYRIQSFAFILSVCTAFVFCCIFIPNLIGFGSTGNRDQIHLENRINPNISTVESITRLPGIGAAKAEAIVAYRKNFRGKTQEDQPFQNPEDLQKVNGIGPKTVQNISQWLKFE
jgi:competence ComEA-like helix-hairpin-helix protein